MDTYTSNRNEVVATRLSLHRKPPPLTGGPPRNWGDPDRVLFAPGPGRRPAPAGCSSGPVGSLGAQGGPRAGPVSGQAGPVRVEPGPAPTSPGPALASGPARRRATGPVVVAQPGRFLAERGRFLAKPGRFVANRAGLDLGRARRQPSAPVSVRSRAPRASSSAADAGSRLTTGLRRLVEALDLMLELHGRRSRDQGAHDDRCARAATPSRPRWVLDALCGRA